jgi:hypothetical protein
MAGNADGTLTPAPESAADALRRIAGRRDDDKLAQAQSMLAEILATDPDNAANKVRRIAATIIALKARRGPAR